MNVISLKNININKLIKSNNKLLTIKELLNQVNYNLDNIYIDRFWYNIKDDKWLYLDNELILWLEYKEIRRGKEQIIKLLKKYNKENEDYKILNNDEFDINEFYAGQEAVRNYGEDNRGLHNKQYITMSPDCFKELCMHVGTKKSKEIKKYYIELEKVFKFYLEYQNEYQKLQLENKNNELENNKKELEEVKEKFVDLSHKIFQYKELKENTYLYVATNKTLSLQNNYKVGVTKNLNLRIINFNNSHNINDKFYYVYTKKIHNAYIVEYMIKHILKEFKNSDKNEIYILDYKYLEKLLDNIINNYNNTIFYYNILMKDYYLNLETKQPDAINIKDSNNDTIEEEINIELEKNSNLNNNEEIKYYNNKEEYPYLEYKNENNKKLFKCLLCNYIFNRVDNLQNHFNRKIKCTEDVQLDKINKIEEIKKQNDNPIIKIIEVENYEINNNYTYYEKYNKEDNKIEYYCNNCSFTTDNLNILKNHYIKRKIKCYEEKNTTEYLYTNNENVECKYYKIDAENFKCHSCDYTGPRSNIIRHLDKKIKCYTKEILKESDGYKYYISYENNEKIYKCYYCSYTSKFQRSIVRHLKESKNKCYG